MEAKKFIVGESYYSRSICDHDCISYMTVISRTEKTVTIRYMDRDKRYKLHTSHDGREWLSKGNYSMAGTWSADRLSSSLTAKDTEYQTESKPLPEAEPEMSHEGMVSLAHRIEGDVIRRLNASGDWSEARKSAAIREALEALVNGESEESEELPANCVQFRRKVA